MSLSIIATVVGLFLSFVGMFGVSEEKHPWVGNVRTRRSLPGWLLIFYPEVGRWILRMTQQDFEVFAQGKSQLTILFNSLTTDLGHFWMAIAGAGWLAILMLVSPKKLRSIEPTGQKPPTVPPPAPIKLQKPKAEVPANPFTPHKPLWKTVYARDRERPWLSETPELRRYHFEEHSPELLALVARFAISRYVDDLKARLTYYDAKGKEILQIEHGCWVDAPEHNEILLAAGNIAAMILLITPPGDGDIGYQAVNDRRNHYAKPYAPIEFEGCDAEPGWSVKMDIFFKGQLGPTYRFELFKGEGPRLQARNIETKETSE